MARAMETSDDRFEYRDLVVPLSLRLEDSRYPTRQELAEFHGYGGVVVQHLAVAAQDGWLPDEAADWDSLVAAGRFATEVQFGVGEAGEDMTTYRSVTIRLKRSAKSG